MLQNIQTEAKVLADTHRKMDPNTHLIYLYHDEKGECIKLLEVSSSVATSGSAEPFSFDATPAEGINHRISIILLSDEEWDDVLKGHLSLPADWNSSKRIEL